MTGTPAFLKVVQSVSPALMILGVAVCVWSGARKTATLILAGFGLGHLFIAHTTYFFGGYRVGNELDYWFVRTQVYPVTRAICPEVCNSWLPPLPDKYSNNTLVAHFRNATRHPVKPLVLKKIQSSVDACFGTRQFVLYTYETIRVARTELERFMRDALTSFQGDQPLTLAKGQCVVHYRAGDFFDTAPELGVTVLNPTHVIRAIQSSGVSCRKLLLLDGGQSHASPRNPVRSRAFLQQLEKRLRVIAPVERVFGTPDQDILIMAQAELLVTGLGSFAMAGAVANIGMRLTPAIRYLNPNDEPRLLPVRARHIAPNWRLYNAHASFSDDSLDDRVMDATTPSTLPSRKTRTQRS